MKIKSSFVTNSSSTSYIIKNRSKQIKTLVDFVLENPQLLEDYKNIYLNPKYDSPEFIKKHSLNGLIESAQQQNITFRPNKEIECSFGDEDGTLIGRVFDYILRDGGSSKNFEWRMISCRGESYE